MTGKIDYLKLMNSGKPIGQIQIELELEELEWVLGNPKIKTLHESIHGAIEAKLKQLRARQKEIESEAGI